MIAKRISTKSAQALFLVSGLWAALTFVFYFGVTEIKLAGHIETSILIAFAMVVSILDLFFILKKKLS